MINYDLLEDIHTYLVENKQLMNLTNTEIYNNCVNTKTVSWEEAIIILDAIKAWKQNSTLFEEGLK